MGKVLDKAYKGLNKTKAAVVAAVALVYIVLTCYSGGSLWELLRFALDIVWYIVLPGLLAVRLLKTGKWMPGWHWPLAILYGTGFFAVLYCFTMRLDILWLLHILPMLLGGAELMLRAFCQQKEGKPWLPRPAWPKPERWMLVLLYAALLLLFTFYFVVKNGRPTAVGDMLLNQDLLWNVGNANSFKIAFPPQDIRFVGVRLHYHYLTELLAGALSIVTGISAYNILAFYLQPYMLGALVLCLYRFGRVVFPKGRLKPLLFTYSLFLFSCASLWKILPNGWSVFWNASITHLITNINSQATATVVLCIFGGLFVQASRQKYKVHPLYFITMICAFILLCFSKGPLAALVAIGVVLVVLLGLPMRRSGWRGLVLGLCVGAAFGVVYVTMFSSGANDSMTFSTFGTLEKGYFYNIIQRLYHENKTLWRIAIPVLWVVQSFLMMPAQFPLYLRGVAGDLRHFNKLTPERLLYNAVAVGGLAAFFLFDHPSMSQTYFLYAAIFFINLLAVDGIDRLPALVQGAKGKTGKAWLKRGVLAGLAFCCAVGVATTGFLYVHMLGSGARQLGRNLGLSEKYPYELVMTADDERAMEWLAENSPQDAMFATNRIHTGGRREGISNLYSALCGRQAFMEGFQYAKTNMGVSVEAITARQAVNEALFSADTSPEQIPVLCRENGISYLVFCTQMEGVDASDVQMGDMVLVWDSPNVRIYAPAMITEGY